MKTTETSRGENMTTAIACASGSLRVSFVNGVLSVFEGASFRADAYAASSSSVIPAGYAALGRIADLKGADYWKHFNTFLEEHNYNASQGVLKGIEVFGPLLRDNLFKEDVPRFLISTSAVVTDEAAQQTQGEKARRLGQRLLLSSRNNDRSWADQHLAAHLFGTMNLKAVLPLTPNNLEEVLYASTRVLQSWKIAATIEEKPYIEAKVALFDDNAPLSEEDVSTITTDAQALLRQLSDAAPFREPTDALKKLGVKALSFAIASLSAFTHEEQQHFLEMTISADRLKKTVNALSRITERTRLTEEIHRIIGGNGHPPKNLLKEL